MKYNNNNILGILADRPLRGCRGAVAPLPAITSIYQSEGGTPNGVMKLPGRVMAGGVVPAGFVFLGCFRF